MKCPLCLKEIELKPRTVEDLCWMAEKAQARGHDELAERIWQIAEEMERQEAEASHE